MTWHDEAKALYAEGWGYTRLSQRFGVSKRQIRNVVNPAAAEKDRASNRRRNAAKRKWDASEKARGRCSSCDGLMGITSRAHGHAVCRTCHLAAIALPYEEIVRLRLAGLKNVEIAAQLGLTYHSVANALCRARKDDPSIPLSPHYRDPVAA